MALIVKLFWCAMNLKRLDFTCKNELLNVLNTSCHRGDILTNYLFVSNVSVKTIEFGQQTLPKLHIEEIIQGTPLKVPSTEKLI